MEHRLRWYRRMINNAKTEIMTAVLGISFRVKRGRKREKRRLVIRQTTS